MENAACSAGICAEKVAATRLVAEGELGFQAIAIATVDGGMCHKACRQVLNEFAPIVADRFAV